MCPINRIFSGAVEAEADTGDGIELLKVSLPCLLTVTKAVNQRLPSFRLKRRGGGKSTSGPVRIFRKPILRASGFLVHPQVERIFAPTKAGEKQLWQGTPQELSQRLVEKLKELKYL